MAPFVGAPKPLNADDGHDEIANSHAGRGFVHRYAERAATLADYSKALALI
jgi:hypothetical protein